MRGLSLRLGGRGGSGGGGSSPASFTVYSKSADETINSDNTFTSDADLQRDLEASTVYGVQTLLLIQGDPTPDFRYTYVADSGLTDAEFWWDDDGGPNNAQSNFTFGSSEYVNLTDAGLVMQTTSAGAVIAGTDPGTFALQWAQNSSNVANTTLKEGSWVSIHEPTASKSSDTTRNSTTTVTADPDLTATLSANTVYAIKGLNLVLGDATGDFKYTLGRTGLADATLYWVGDMGTPTTQPPNGFGTEVSALGVSPTVRNFSSYVGSIVTGANTGDLQLQWAQNVSNANDTSLKQGSWLSVTEPTVSKSADTTRNSTTTVAADPDLAVALSANTTYAIYGNILAEGNQTADFKWTLGRTGLSDATLYFEDDGAPVALNNAFSFGDEDVILFASANVHQFTLIGSIVTGADPGTLSFQWAQNTSNAGDTTVKAGSWLEVVAS